MTTSPLLPGRNLPFNAQDVQDAFALAETRQDYQDTRRAFLKAYEELTALKQHGVSFDAAAIVLTGLDILACRGIALDALESFDNLRTLNDACKWEIACFAARYMALAAMATAAVQRG